MIRHEQLTGLKLNLRQISDKVGVGYHRLWAFMSATRDIQLTAAEVEQIFERLSGRPLLPTGGHQ